LRELSSLPEMRSWSRTERSRRHTIGFVPTMGYFHEGLADPRGTNSSRRLNS